MGGTVTALVNELGHSLRGSLTRNKSQNGGGGGSNSLRGSLRLSANRLKEKGQVVSSTIERSLKREDSMKKEIKKPTSQAAARAATADDTPTAASAASAAASAVTLPSTNTTAASAAADPREAGTNEDVESRDGAPEEDEAQQESQDFVPHRTDGHTYHEAAMLGLDQTTPRSATVVGQAASKDTTRKKKAMKLPSFL